MQYIQNSPMSDSTKSMIWILGILCALLTIVICVSIYNSKCAKYDMEIVGETDCGLFVSATTSPLLKTDDYCCQPIISTYTTITTTNSIIILSSTGIYGKINDKCIIKVTRNRKRFLYIGDNQTPYYIGQ
jgi:hypothetical protein